MIRIPLKVKANLLTQEELVTIASGSSNSIKVKFDIDPNSDFADSALQKRAIFRYYQGSYFISDVDANGEVYVPKFVIAYPYFKVALRAENETATVVVTTNEVQVPVEKSPVFYETTITDGDVTIRNLDGALNIYKAGDVTFIDFTVSYKTAVDAVIAGTYATASALNSVASDVDSIKEDVIDMSNSINDLQGDIEDLEAGKQNTLVSGENIKTINGTSLLGSGDFSFDTTLNETSTNAVQNKVITEYITELESKVLTLAVKVYNHDVALGTLNIENVLYSVENADSFAIPTTIGTNADVVIPKSRMALSAIKGKTEYSRNLLKVNDIPPTTENGVTYSCSNGIVTVNGTCTEQIIVFLAPSANTRLPSGQLSYRFINRASDTYELQLASADNNTYINPTNENQTGTITNSSADNSWYFALIIRAGKTYSNNKFACMVVQGSTAPTSFVPYYTGLKNVELNSLNVYGKTDNYTELRIGDEVTCLYLPDLSSVTTSLNVSINLDGVTLYISPSWKTNGYQYDKADEILAWTGSAYSETHGHAILEGGGFLYLRKPRKITTKYGSATSVNNVKNATSVKSILPLSILPKTLASYERLEVVDNGDDTYKIDLVSHAELHVGDEINSLWVGNPQANDFPTTGYSALGLSFNVPSGDMDWWVPSPSVSGYNRIILTSGNTYISNLEDLVDNNPRLYFGGNDTFVDKVTTNRNVVVKFKNALTITAFKNILTESFRNGEETRTTLIDNLSLDDISAVIDTGDIIYADNSNAEYDVSIAETSVELLVNKAN